MSIVTHDLKNPISAISLAIRLANKLIQEPGFSKEKLEHCLGTVTKSSDILLRLANDLVDSENIELGRFSLKMREVNVAELISDLAISLNAIVVERSLRLEVQTPDHAIPIACDPDRINQVLWNLIQNAIKFTPKNGTILLRVTNFIGDQSVRFEVSDTGIGISKEQLGFVFNRYWQAPENAHKGSGLGLHIAKGIVEAHRGRIWVESQRGKGSSFFFELPVSSLKNQTC